MIRWKETLSEPYSEHCQLSKIEPFGKIVPGSSRLKLSQKVPAELFDWVLNMVSSLWNITEWCYSVVYRFCFKSNKSARVTF